MVLRCWKNNVINYNCIKSFSKLRNDSLTARLTQRLIHNNHPVPVLCLLTQWIPREVQPPKVWPPGKHIAECLQVSQLVVCADKLRQVLKETQVGDVIETVSGNVEHLQT